MNTERRNAIILSYYRSRAAKRLTRVARPGPRQHAALASWRASGQPAPGASQVFPGGSAGWPASFSVTPAARSGPRIIRRFPISPRPACQDGCAVAPHSERTQSSGGQQTGSLGGICSVVMPSAAHPQARAIRSSRSTLVVELPCRIRRPLSSRQATRNLLLRAVQTAGTRQDTYFQAVGPAA